MKGVSPSTANQTNKNENDNKYTQRIKTQFIELKLYITTVFEQNLIRVEFRGTRCDPYPRILISSIFNSH